MALTRSTGGFAGRWAGLERVSARSQTSSGAPLVRHLARFVARVTRAFIRNRGLLLASAVGYNALLSIVPLLAISLVALSHFADERVALQIVVGRARSLLPGLASALAESVPMFLAQRDVIGVGGLAVLVLLASLAFRVLEQAMEVIFEHHDCGVRRSWWSSLLIQFAYVPLVGALVTLFTGLTVLADGLSDGLLFRVRWIQPLHELASPVAHAANFVGLTLLLSSFYWLMPVGRVRRRVALAGGAVAAALWELITRGLGWYFASVSMVNVVYGSLGGLVVVLLGLEAFAIVLLLGAQVVAEIDRSLAAGLRWYEPAADRAPCTDTDGNG